MKAFLLTAGLGTRLRPLTDKTPKCLLPINGTPLLRIWLELLGRNGVEQVLINTHWHHDKVQDFVKQNVNSYSIFVNREETIVNGYSLLVNEKKRKDGKKWPEIKLFYEPELLGSGGTLLANRDWVDDGKPFFILYGDNLTHLDLGQLYAFHCRSALPFSLGVFKTTHPERCGIAEIDENGVVIDFVEKPEHPMSHLAHAGMNVADSRIFDFYPPMAESIRPLDLGFHVIPNLAGKMKAYFIEEFLMDIGTPESYVKAQAIWSR